MARPRITNEQLVASARQVAQQTQDIGQLRQALAVLLPAELNASLEQTAGLLGVGRATVSRLQSRFRRRGEAGRNRQGWGDGAARAAERRGRTGVPAALGRTSDCRWSVGFVADSRSAGAALGA